MFGIKLGLEGPKELLRKFLAFPNYNTKVIHVAGTNGKGSVCAMMEMLIRGAGHRVGIFTSPHLVHYRERMKVNTLMVSEEKCAHYLTEIRRVCEKLPNHPTFFEITLAVAMRYFKEEGAEYIILETGMGGRLDATTAVPADLCVITPIGMDHSQWLGDTLEEIAKEKAGIMLPGVPVISAGQEEDAKMVLLEEANEIRCPIEIIDEPLKGYSIGIPGEHQKYNANLAVNAVHEVGIHLNYDTVKECLDHVYWPGRFENVGSEEMPVVLDGAHNPHAAKALAETWQTEFPNQKPTVIFGAVESKDVAGALKYLESIAERFIFTPVDSPRSLETSVLEEAAEDFENTSSVESFDQAFEFAKSHNSPILIAGSLFLIGQVKAMLENGSFERSAQ